MINISINDKQLEKSVINNKTILTTITNYGYILYTLNMLKSLKRFNGLDKKVLIVCMDNKSDSILKKLGYNTLCINNNTLQHFTPWNTKGYDEICYIKLVTIYKLLELEYNVLLIDGDIVFLRNPLDDIHSWSNDKSGDVWVQNDSQVNSNTLNMCTGYIYIKASTTTKMLYDCISSQGILKYKQCALDNNDQSYFNKFIRPYCIMNPLELEKYPNGKYFYNNPHLKETCILVHFNWVHGHQKLLKIKEHKMWLLTEDEEETLNI